MKTDFAHHLGKTVRKRIIQELIAEYGNRKLAEMLGVSPAAISKYAAGLMHPSDATMSKALKIAEGRLRSKIAKLIVYDLASALSSALDAYDESIEWSKELEELYLKLALKRPYYIGDRRKLLVPRPST